MKEKQRSLPVGRLGLLVMGLGAPNRRAADLAEEFTVFRGRQSAHASAFAFAGKLVDAGNSVPSLCVGDRPVSIPHELIFHW
jgi:hypothetical protein